MYGTDNCDRIKRDLEWAQREAEDLRYREEERQRREERERQERKREREEEANDRLHYVTNWDDAFRNGIYLYRKEAQEEARDNATIEKLIAEDPSLDGQPGYKSYHFFQERMPQVEKAAEIYLKHKDAIEERIAALRRDLLNDVATEVEAETGNAELAEALREDNPQYLTNW